jgi:hypothetical protein
VGCICGAFNANWVGSSEAGLATSAYDRALKCASGSAAIGEGGQTYKSVIMWKGSG